jgi:hypothetical protein
VTSPLYPTPHRKAFLRAVRLPGRIYREAGQAWDRDEGTKVTARLDEAFQAGWVEPLPDTERNPRMHLSGRVYYRLSPAGELIIQKGQS